MNWTFEDAMRMADGCLNPIIEKTEELDRPTPTFLGHKCGNGYSYDADRTAGLENMPAEVRDMMFANAMYVRAQAHHDLDWVYTLEYITPENVEKVLQYVLGYLAKADPGIMLRHYKVTIYHLDRMKLEIPLWLIEGLTASISVTDPDRGTGFGYMRDHIEDTKKLLANYWAGKPINEA
jgi:hypothetical protein